MCKDMIIPFMFISFENLIFTFKYKIHKISKEFISKNLKLKLKKRSNNNPNLH